MHGFTARPSSRVQEKLVALLHLVQYYRQVAVREENATLDQVVGRLLYHRFEPTDQDRVDGRAAKFGDQLLIVNALLRAGLDIPRVNFIFFTASGGGVSLTG